MLTLEKLNVEVTSGIFARKANFKADFRLLNENAKQLAQLALGTRIDAQTKIDETVDKLKAKMPIAVPSSATSPQNLHEKTLPVKQHRASIAPSGEQRIKRFFMFSSLQTLLLGSRLLVGLTGWLSLLQL